MAIRYPEMIRALLERDRREVSSRNQRQGMRPIEQGRRLSAGGAMPADLDIIPVDQSAMPIDALSAQARNERHGMRPVQGGRKLVEQGMEAEVNPYVDQVGPSPQTAQFRDSSMLVDDRTYPLGPDYDNSIPWKEHSGRLLDEGPPLDTSPDPIRDTRYITDTLGKYSQYQLDSETPPEKRSLVGDLYSAIQSAETGKEVGAGKFIRTRHAPKEGSSAYGPAQITKGRMTDALNFGIIPPGNTELVDYAKRFIAQANKFLKYGKNKDMGLAGYHKRYDYGGAGDLTSLKDQALYHKVAKLMIKDSYKNAQDVNRAASASGPAGRPSRSGGNEDDIQRMLAGWRFGPNKKDENKRRMSIKDQMALDPSYFNRFNAAFPYA